MIMVYAITSVASHTFLFLHDNALAYRAAETVQRDGLFHRLLHPRNITLLQ